MNSKFLVCGGRDYDNVDEMYAILDDYHARYTIGTIISGHAKGADQMAEMWADERGVKVELYPADWDTHGKTAGPIRNQEMLDFGKPDMVIAFPTKNSRGTWDMVRRTNKAGVKLYVVE